MILGHMILFTQIQKLKHKLLCSFTYITIFFSHSCFITQVWLVLSSGLPISSCSLDLKVKWHSLKNFSARYQNGRWPLEWTAILITMTNLNIWIPGLSPFVIYSMKYQFKIESYDMIINCLEKWITEKMTKLRLCIWEMLQVS